MTGFTPKTYQPQVLDSIEAYFQACRELPSASVAFTAATERLWGQGLAYHPLSGFSTDMPYFCLRALTGGGKTWLAAQSVRRANTYLLRCKHSVIQSADAVTPYSIASMLRLRQPFVIVGEAHNSRTELAFDMLARLRPSGVMELTATSEEKRWDWIEERLN